MKRPKSSAGNSKTKYRSFNQKTNNRSNNQIAFNNYGTVSRTNITNNSSSINIVASHKPNMMLTKEISDISISIKRTPTITSRPATSANQGRGGRLKSAQKFNRINSNANFA